MEAPTPAMLRNTPTLMLRFPSVVLDTELQLKGESDDADAALSGLVVWLATAGRRA